MPGAGGDDRDSILYGERPAILKQQELPAYDWKTYPVLKDTHKLGLDTYAFRRWSYVGVGSCWCGAADWAVDLGGNARDKIQEFFPGDTVFEVEESEILFEDAPLGPLRSNINTAVRSWREAKPCELRLHRPDVEAIDEAASLPLPDPRVEVRYQMQEREYVDQASLAVLQTVEILKPKNVRLDWRYLSRAGGLVAYDARYDKLQALIATRGLQSTSAI